ncbi:hypothetical protein FOZ63_000941 [Perkinsus olseni]|uniref:Uncharacterized protein n=1 Tax=Perkinsus olseni TaxID=32597 RepID=A0A7J6PZS2_PEROL|nr:hypothetical protein FOZ63_000941 [Perkinsus olseni]
MLRSLEAALVRYINGVGGAFNEIGGLQSALEGPPSTESLAGGESSESAPSSEEGESCYHHKKEPKKIFTKEKVQTHAALGGKLCTLRPEDHRLNFIAAFIHNDSTVTLDTSSCPTKENDDLDLWRCPDSWLLRRVQSKCMILDVNNLHKSGGMGFRTLNSNALPAKSFTDVKARSDSSDSLDEPDNSLSNSLDWSLGSQSDGSLPPSRDSPPGTPASSDELDGVVGKFLGYLRNRSRPSSPATSPSDESGGEIPMRDTEELGGMKRKKAKKKASKRSSLNSFTPSLPLLETNYDWDDVREALKKKISAPIPISQPDGLPKILETTERTHKPRQKGSDPEKDTAQEPEIEYLKIDPTNDDACTSVFVYLEYVLRCGVPLYTHVLGHPQIVPAEDTPAYFLRSFCHSILLTS